MAGSIRQGAAILAVTAVIVGAWPATGSDGGPPSVTVSGGALS